MTSLVRRAAVQFAVLAVLPFGATMMARPASAQILGLPVLQNAFTNPGLTAGINYGGGGGASTFAFAAAWAPGAGRVQLSAGAGTYDAGGTTNRGGTYGARVAFSLKQFAGGSVGVAPFAGVGYASMSKVSVGFVPIGVGLGFRHALGATRAFSAYATPFYALNRQKVNGASLNGNLFRVSIGADVALLRSVGLTAGLETGAKAGAAKPGANSSIFGVGLSYAF